MKNLLIILFCIPFIAASQPGAVIRNDTAFMFDPETGIYTQVTKQDTNALPRFTEKVKGLITWGNVQGKPSSYTPAPHYHVKADITDFGSYVNVSDSASMLSKYFRKQDSAVMLSPYLRANVAAVTYQLAGNYATGGGTATGTNTGDQDLSGYVPINRTINGFDLSANRTITTVSGNAGTATALQNARTINGISFDGTANITVPIPIAAQVNLTAQAANIGTTILYAVPSAGFYRVSIYITVTQAATTSSTMPSTTISYTDGNSGTNSHSTTTTATNASNSVTTSFAQTTYVLYAKASTNIQYATGSYASSGATAMQYALRIRVEAL